MVGCHLVVHYWADLQSVYGFRCYDNTAPNAKCQRVLVLALCLGFHGPVARNSMFDLLRIRCGFRCTACCTTNLQQIGQVEFST